MSIATAPYNIKLPWLKKTILFDIYIILNFLNGNIVFLFYIPPNEQIKYEVKEITQLIYDWISVG